MRHRRTSRRSTRHIKNCAESKRICVGAGGRSVASDDAESRTEIGIGGRGESGRASVAAEEAENAGKAGETSKVTKEG